MNEEESVKRRPVLIKEKDYRYFKCPNCHNYITGDWDREYHKAVYPEFCKYCKQELLWNESQIPAPVSLSDNYKVKDGYVKTGLFTKLRRLITNE